MNYSLIKKIDCSDFPLKLNSNMGQVLYLSQNLFSADSKIDFMYAYQPVDNKALVYTNL